MSSRWDWGAGAAIRGRVAMWDAGVAIRGRVAYPDGDELFAAMLD